MKRFDARTAVLQALKDKGLYRDTKENPMVVPICRYMHTARHMTSQARVNTILSNSFVNSLAYYKDMLVMPSGTTPVLQIRIRNWLGSIIFYGKELKVMDLIVCFSLAYNKVDILAIT